MTDLDKKINMLLMEEMGLEEGDRRRVIDQDTGALYQMKGRDLVSPGSQSGKMAIEFDPINNARMMSFMFGNFVDKLVNDETIPPVTGYHIDTHEKDRKFKASINFADNTTVSSDYYNNETTAYADLILRLNGDDDPDVREYDIDRRKAPQSVKAPKKKGPRKPKGATKEEKKND